jgi:flagellar biosynthesis protein FlhB
MTPQEFQEEMKGMEADPKVRLRREQGSRSHTAR